MAAPSESKVLQEILTSLKSIQQENTQLAAAVDAINGRVNILAGVKQMQDGTVVDAAAAKHIEPREPSLSNGSSSVPAVSSTTSTGSPASPSVDSGRRPSVTTTSKIILTSYPGQAGVDPLPVSWGHKDPAIRGPIVVSRNPGTIRRRNGKYLGQAVDASRRLTISQSHWCPWWIVLHLSCPCRCKQRS